MSELHILGFLVWVLIVVAYKTHQIPQMLIASAIGVFIILGAYFFYEKEVQGPGLNFVSGQAPWSIQSAEGCYYWRDKDGNFAGYWLLNDGVTAKCNGAKNKK